MHHTAESTSQNQLSLEHHNQSKQMVWKLVTHHGNIVNSKENIMEHLEDILQCLLPAILLQSNFQPKPSNHIRESMILEDAQVPKEAQDKLSSLLQTKFDSIVSNLSNDMRRSNLFEMDIPTTGPPTAHKPYPILLTYQKFVDEGI